MSVREIYRPKDDNEANRLDAYVGALMIPGFKPLALGGEYTRSELMALGGEFHPVLNEPSVRAPLGSLVFMQEIEGRAGRHYEVAFLQGRASDFSVSNVSRMAREKGLDFAEAQRLRMQELDGVRFKVVQGPIFHIDPKLIEG